MKVQPRTTPSVEVTQPVKPVATSVTPATKRAVTNPPQLKASEGQPLTGAAGLGWGTSGYWLDHTLLKPAFASNLPLDDVSDGPPPVGVELPVLLDTDTREGVYEKLRAVPLERLLVSPGYRYYRHPEQFAAVLAQVQTGNRVDVRPSIVNVHTDGHGHVTNVDLHSHHLRMAAFIENGATKLGDLPFDQVLIKVDGMRRDDTYFPVRAHGYALPAEVIEREGVHLVEGEDLATVAIANLQNFELGSRTSLKQFHATLLHRVQPKIGVVYGSGPEVLARALALKAERGLDEVVVAPQGPIDAKLREAVQQTAGVNLYLDEPVPLSTFPGVDWQRLVKYRLNLIYGTDLDGIVS